MCGRSVRLHGLATKCSVPVHIAIRDAVGVGNKLQLIISVGVGIESGDNFGVTLDGRELLRYSICLAIVVALRGTLLLGELRCSRVGPAILHLQWNTFAIGFPFSHGNGLALGEHVKTSISDCEPDAVCLGLIEPNGLHFRLSERIALRVRLNEHRAQHLGLNQCDCIELIICEFYTERFVQCCGIDERHYERLCVCKHRI